MISSRTRALAIIGDPIEHSLTPRIQNAAWQNKGVDVVNLAFHVTPENLPQAVKGARALGFLGLMVTIPHKEAVLALCDELDDSARDMGAANLLHFRTDGKTIGYSTDGWAAIKSLDEESVAVKGARIAILGGGGAARSLALTFAQEGAATMTILNRTIERAQAIADEVARHNIETRAASLDNYSLRQTIPETDVLVNATSLGMYPNINETPIAREFLSSHLALYDIVYNPLQTRLLREAQERGCKTIDGLGMLIYTNVRAAQICADHDISASLMREEALRALTGKV